MGRTSTLGAGTCKTLNSNQLGYYDSIDLKWVLEKNPMTSLNLIRPGENFNLKTIWLFPSWRLIIAKWYDEEPEYIFFFSYDDDKANLFIIMGRPRPMATMTIFRE